jgi:hypothetical protein
MWSTGRQSSRPPTRGETAAFWGVVVLSVALPFVVVLPAAVRLTERVISERAPRKSSWSDALATTALVCVSVDFVSGYFEILRGPAPTDRSELIGRQVMGVVYWSLPALAVIGIVVGLGRGMRKRRIRIAAEQRQAQARQEQAIREEAARSALRVEIRTTLLGEQESSRQAQSWSRDERTRRMEGLLTQLDRCSAGQLRWVDRAALTGPSSRTAGELAFLANYLAARGLIVVDHQYPVDQVRGFGFEPVYPAGVGVNRLALTREGLGQVDKRNGNGGMVKHNLLINSIINAGHHNQQAIGADGSTQTSIASESDAVAQLRLVIEDYRRALDQAELDAEALRQAAIDLDTLERQIERKPLNKTIVAELLSSLRSLAEGVVGNAAFAAPGHRRRGHPADPQAGHPRGDGLRSDGVSPGCVQPRLHMHLQRRNQHLTQPQSFFLQDAEGEASHPAILAAFNALAVVRFASRPRCPQWITTDAILSASSGVSLLGAVGLEVRTAGWLGSSASPTPG